VEFAVVLPVLLLVLGAIMEFGFVFMAGLTVRHAAQVAARKASLPAVTMVDVLDTIEQAMHGLPYDPPVVVLSTGYDNCISSVTITIPYEDISITGGALGNPVPNGVIVGSFVSRKESCNPL
jgi:hypothetical protein